MSPTTSTCVLCSVQYPNCASCNTSPPVSCILCQSGFILNSTGNCQACSVSIQYCTTCSSLTVCTACSTPYVVAQSGSLCASTTCVNSFCATCSIQNTNVCYSCTISGYYVINQTCLTTCGDGIKVGL